MSVDLTPEPMLVDPHDNTKYTILERIGEGTFSVVYRAKRKVTAATKSTCNLRGVDPNIVALKCIHPNSSPSRILNELKYLKMLGGKNNVLPLLGGFRERCGFIAILPYFEHDDFKWYLPRLSTSMLRVYLHGLFSALAHVAKLGIIHRDIKPRNYLFSLKRQQGLLIDFGLAQGPAEWQPALEAKGLAWNGAAVVKREATVASAKSASADALGGLQKRGSQSMGKDDTENVAPASKRQRKLGRGVPGNSRHGGSAPTRVRAERAGTPGFRAPEVLFMSLEQTPAIDMWSAGVIMLSLLSSRYPIFPKPERGNISSDAQAIVQLEALLGRGALERAAKSCDKELVETPGDKNPITPPSLRQLCQEGRNKFYEEVLKKQPNPQKLDNFPFSVYDLLHQCLEVEASRRLSARDALKHPFFETVQ